ncbi:MAG: MMPL family transporter [Bacteroidales bacterium]|nr:MMPL family transporter [Bacteroidales bacterium]
MGNIFLYLFRLFEKHKMALVILVITILAVSGYYTAQLKLSEDITKVLPDNTQINQMSFVYSNSKFLDKVVFNIRLKDSAATANPGLLVDFANRFSDSLVAEHFPRGIRSIDKAPGESALLDTYTLLYDYLPLFLNEADYARIDTLIAPEQIGKTLQSDYKTLISPAGFATKKMIKKDPLHLTQLALEKLKSFGMSDNFELYQNHFLSKDHRNLLLIVSPAHTNNTAVNSQLFEGIDQLIAQLTTGDFSKIQVEYFGNAVVALGNAQRIKKDILITVSLAMLLLIVFISVFFKRKRAFFLVFLPVLFGALVALAVLFLVQGEVSAISLGIGSILLGISVDYALHVFSHYREHNNIRLLLKDISTPVILSSLTTAAAFLSLHFINSQALNDLGLFAAVSVLSAALFSLLVLPHLLKSKKPKEPLHKKGWIDRLANIHFEKSKWVKAAILLLTLLFFFLAQQVQFDADMMKNSYMSDELKKAEQNLNAVTNLSKKTIYLVTPGKTLDEALGKNEIARQIIDSLTAIGLIKNATVVNRLLQSKASQEKAFGRWKDFWEKRRLPTINATKEKGSELGFKATAFTRFYDLLNKDFSTLAPGQANPLSSMLLDNYLIDTDSLDAVINVVKVDSRTEDIERVYAAFGKQEDTWVIDKRLVTSEFMRILNDNFNKLILVSLSLVFLILLLAYGRIELTILTMLPVVISWIWTVGIMGLFGISFNIFNVIILTFIFGLGIDYSIFVMRGLLQNYKYGSGNFSTYKVSVLLSGITTLLGIGVLIFAKHPALRSIATMSIIGILTVIFITFSLLPPVFKWMVSYKKGMRNRPVTLLDFFFSIAALLVFMGGAVFMTLLSFVMRMLPGNGKKKKLFFHTVFSKLTWFLIYMNFLSKKTIINPSGEDYSKPAIIIANHQSHIDLMLMMLLNPRVVILTNDRNYNNPVYGPALRYAGFIPSDEGFENIVNDVRKKVKDGYSLVIYPEGHRNDTGRIKRFHKGAFYLARQLGLDILPIIIHGQNQLLKKSEFFLKRGAIVTKFLPRIDLSRNEFGQDLKETTRGIRKYFSNEYDKVREQYETPEYFRDFILKNYLYKGPVLEWYTRIKLRLEDNYTFFNNLIPRHCTVTDLGCGYGYLAFVLNLVAEDRKITGLDYDEDKIAVAGNCAIRRRNVSFMAADITQAEPDKSDVFILLDVLHYLPEPLQIETIEKCIGKLNKGGLIIIRDADKSLERRHKGTQITEFFSTRSGFNKTRYKLDFVARSMIKRIAEKHKLKLEIVDNSKLTSNLVYLLRAD